MEEPFKIQFEDILTFATGAMVPPAIGFTTKPKIVFHEEGPYPCANTCANTLMLPIQKPMPDAEGYMYNIAFGILNTVGFGRI